MGPLRDLGRRRAFQVARNWMFSRRNHHARSFTSAGSLMSADFDQPPTEPASANQADSKGSESLCSSPLLGNEFGSIDPAISKSASIETPSIATSGTVLPLGFDSDRTVISKATP